MSSAEPSPAFGSPGGLLTRHGAVLLSIARRSIEHGLRSGRSLPLEPDNHPHDLRAERATFVTLTREGRLRGCVGKVKACRPVVVDVAENAFAAAFDDRRFSPLTDPELDELDIEISLLSPAEPLVFTSEADLLRQLRPGKDGLIFADGTHRGLFLPTVWRSLPQAKDFLAQLKVKADLALDHWSPTVTVARFTTETVSLSKLGTRA